ncbi:MAG TPA: hypothetical protein VFL94_03715 [Actinomycetales bacterium]|nr:hypothetical protein [Actinomycetales bacterium]
MRAALVAVLLAVLAATSLLTSCSDDDGPRSPSTPSAVGTAAPSTAGSAVERLTTQLLGTTPDGPVLASSAGTVEINGKRSRLVAEVLEVRATTDTTLLRWRLRSASGESTEAYGFWLSHPPRFDSRRVTLLDTTGKQALSPFTYDRDEIMCVCSTVPKTVDGDGEPMYALFPPLDPSTPTVDVTLPGFPPATGIPVTRP